ncbi:MAG TPA: hypothetical protein VG096_04640 [Bryobacteraceae bacterium]|jgi:hypothetical protein|nr:hypothetical protein [Bryobacteraceae bacterium]
MTARRCLILVAMVGGAHNLLRLLAGLLGAKWGFFNYLHPFHLNFGGLGSSAIAACVCGILALLFWAARRGWREPEEESSSPMLSSALWSALATVPLGVFAVAASTMMERTYGWTLFLLVPLFTGFMATLLLGQRRTISVRNALLVSIVAVMLLGGALIAVAIEGVICLVMALPLALPLAMVGGLLGYWLLHLQGARNPAMFLLIAGLTPFGAGLEHAFLPADDWFQVTTAIELPASPGLVWQTILEPAKLAPPSHPLFRAGVAFPLASHIEGFGPSATRYCDFSTGKLVEPVLIWDDRRQLRFTVASNPLPMQEWTPYSQIHPPHLDGFLISKQGEFRLTELSDGGTRLEATTWYQHHLAPAHYWRWWSDYIIHRVHEMVLGNIRERVLANSSLPLSR